MYIVQKKRHHATVIIKNFYFELERAGGRGLHKMLLGGMTVTRFLYDET